LKALEEGVLRFIGSTTQNPYFAINNAVLSRVRSIYEFRPLSVENILVLLKRTLDDKERGFGSLKIHYDEKALRNLADMSEGDARIALDTLGFIIDNLKKEGKIDNGMIREAMQKRTVFYDKSEDKYNLLSALQKSIRGSDPDASIHYLARLIEGGADEMMIGRRLMVIASEDVGMAYPNAITVVTACVQAAHMVGFPEARINLAEAVILLASCPKSNRAYMALESAQRDLENRKTGDVPPALKDSHYGGAKKRGIGEGYKYPHDYGGYVKQQYLPDELHKEGVKYYEPTGNGSEASFKKYLESLREKKK
jgi:putative ATPase